MRTKSILEFNSCLFLSNFSLSNVFNNIGSWNSNIAYLISYRFLNNFDVLSKNRLKNLFSRVVKDLRVWDEIIKMINSNIINFSSDYFFYEKNFQIFDFLSFFLFQVYSSELDFYVSNLALRLNTKNALKKKEFWSVDFLKVKLLVISPLKYSKFTPLVFQNCFCLNDLKSSLVSDSFIKFKENLFFEKTINYVRYMDSFLLGISGSKNFAVRINSKIVSFLRGNLHLSLNYCNFSSSFEYSTYFLGYQIQCAYFN